MLLEFPRIAAEVLRTNRNSYLEGKEGNTQNRGEYNPLR